VTRASAGLPDHRQAEKTTILLVDDDPFQAFALRAALENEFPHIERALDASEAFIRVEQPALADKLGLVIAGLRLPGLAGPTFVSELRARLPGTPVLVIGRAGESAKDYLGLNVRFLPREASSEELHAAVKAILEEALLRVA
jgi:DNA-binding response OmpR family regulator